MRVRTLKLKRFRNYIPKALELSDKVLLIIFKHYQRPRLYLLSNSLISTILSQRLEKSADVALAGKKYHYSAWFYFETFYDTYWPPYRDIL